MPFNYGGRNGVSTLIRTVKYLCKLYLAFANPIITWINGSTLNSEQKTIVLAWLNGMQEACMILETVQVTYENA